MPALNERASSTSASEARRMTTLPPRRLVSPTKPPVQPAQGRIRRVGHSAAVEHEAGTVEMGDGRIRAASWKNRELASGLRSGGCRPDDS